MTRNEEPLEGCMDYQVMDARGDGWLWLIPPLMLGAACLLGAGVAVAALAVGGLLGRGCGS